MQKTEINKIVKDVETSEEGLQEIVNAITAHSPNKLIVIGATKTELMSIQYNCKDVDEMALLFVTLMSQDEKVRAAAGLALAAVEHMESRNPQRIDRLMNEFITSMLKKHTKDERNTTTKGAEGKN